MCCRAPHGATCGRMLRWLCLWCRAVLHVATQFHVPPRTHGATRGKTLRCFQLCCRAVLRVAAQFHVLRTPHDATRSRTLRLCLWCRAVLRVAAQFHVLLRGKTLHHLRAATQLYMLPRNSTCRRALPGATRGIAL